MSDDTGLGRRVVQVAYQVQVCLVSRQRSAPWNGQTWECDPACGRSSTMSGGHDFLNAHQSHIRKGKRADDCVWDSGVVHSSKHGGIRYNGEALRSDSTYAWRVRWWAATPSFPSVNFTADFSSIARFDTGFVVANESKNHNEDGIVEWPLEADWIGVSPVVFSASRLGTTQLRYAFSMQKQAVVTRARVFVASPG